MTTNISIIAHRLRRTLKFAVERSGIANSIRSEITPRVEDSIQSEFERRYLDSQEHNDYSKSANDLEVSEKINYEEILKKYTKLYDQEEEDDGFNDSSMDIDEISSSVSDTRPLYQNEASESEPSTPIFYSGDSPSFLPLSLYVVGEDNIQLDYSDKWMSYRFTSTPIVPEPEIMPTSELELKLPQSPNSIPTTIFSLPSPIVPAPNLTSSPISSSTLVEHPYSVTSNTTNSSPSKFSSREHCDLMHTTLLRSHSQPQKRLRSRSRHPPRPKPVPVPVSSNDADVTDPIQDKLEPMPALPCVGGGPIRRIRRLDKTNRIALKEGTHYKKTDLNLFICLYCEGDKIAICSRLNDFRRHFEGKHGKVLPYPCRNCNQRFRRSEKLLKHLKSKPECALFDRTV